MILSRARAKEPFSAPRYKVSLGCIPVTVNVNLRRIAIQNSGIVCMTLLHTCRFITLNAVSFSLFLSLARSFIHSLTHSPPVLSFSLSLSLLASLAFSTSLSSRSSAVERRCYIETRFALPLYRKKLRPAVVGDKKAPGCMYCAKWVICMRKYLLMRRDDGL